MPTQVSERGPHRRITDEEGHEQLTSRRQRLRDDAGVAHSGDSDEDRFHLVRENGVTA
jgi:hypothetical protein